MMSKTLTAAAVIVGMMSVGAIAGPKKPTDSRERAMTRQLNEQQLAMNATGQQMGPSQAQGMAQPPAGVPSASNPVPGPMTAPPEAVAPPANDPSAAPGTTTPVPPQ